MKFFLLLLTTLTLASCSITKKNTPKGYDKQLSTFEYPYDVLFFKTKAQNQNIEMAYMDIGDKNSLKIIALLHGKNFSGYYFEPLAKDLVQQGFRVIIPDQIGFGKSTKPNNFQFSFHQLAELTHHLLDELKVKKTILVGHSMGGMLATRFSLMYPEQVTKLILINPIGLEDYKVLTPYKDLNFLYQQELSNTEDKIRDYQKQFYYDGQWSEKYEELIQPAIGWLNGNDKNLLAKNASQTTEMLYTQPVFYEFEKLKVPTTLINGDRDKTAPGKPWAKPEMQKTMGDYPKLGRVVAKKIPDGKLIELKGLGHVPFIEDYETFSKVFYQEVLAN